MPTPDLANVPLNQVRGLPVLQSGGAAGGGGTTVGGVVVRKWTAAQLSLENVTPTVDSNGHVYIATPFLTLNGCRSFTALVQRTDTPPTLVLPSVIPIGGAGAWGLAGAPTYAQALQTNDGDGSFTQSATIPAIPMRVAFEKFIDPGNYVGWVLHLIARRAGGVGDVAPEVGASVVGGADALLAGGVAITPFTVLVPPFGPTPDAYADYTQALAPGESAAIAAANALNPASFVVLVLSSGGGGAGGGVVNATQAYIELPGSGLLPAEAPFTAWFQQRRDSSDVAPTSLPGGSINLPFCGMSECNTAPTTFPATSTIGEVQRALCAWDLAEVMGAAGTPGSEQADARVLISFGTTPTAPGARFSVTLWGTT